MGSVSRRDPILLPAPQRLRPEQGAHRLRPGRLIHVTGGERAALLRIGAAVRDALAEAGASWQLTAHGGSGPEIGARVAVDPARVSRAQGYLLTVGPERIDIAGHDEAGAFYGAMTLRQIARQARDGVLPCLRIADHPDIAHRGVMLDVSRDRVPTMETLFGLVDLLSEWKVNQLQLYTEHTFAYRDHREVWADWSPMTGEQVMELDAYCRDRYVELVANQNTFGHLARWMVHPRYRPLCEDDDPAVFHPHRGLYGTLCPTDPGSIALVDELLEELLPHFTSRQVHIGCDEARIGLARSRRIVEERGAGPVYLDYVRQVHELVRRRGRTTQLWGDVLINHPELAAELPARRDPGHGRTTRRTRRSAPTPRPACRRGCRSTSRRGSTAGAPSSATRPPRWPTSAAPVRARCATALPACSTPTGATTATGSTCRWRSPATRTVRQWPGRRRRTRTRTCRPRWTRTPSATRPE